MGWVIFWLVVTAVLSALLVLWYVWVLPPRRFRVPDPLHWSTRFKTVVGWDTTHTVKNCPACGGAGALQYRNGRSYVIPRAEWEQVIWRRANVTKCPGCHGLGYVGRNWRPPPRFRWPEGAPVAA